MAKDKIDNANDTNRDESPAVIQTQPTTQEPALTSFQLNGDTKDNVEPTGQTNTDQSE